MKLLTKILKKTEYLRFNMTLKTKIEILNWLEKNDSEYKDNIRNNTYEFIDIHDDMNKALLEEMIKKDNLIEDFFENLKKEGHHYIVNVKGNIDISSNKLEIIPIQFYHVTGDFYCAGNNLTSLKGCPHDVGDIFNCSYNQLTSLDYCPKIIGRNFFCHNNRLISLKYCPESIHGDFYCCMNQLVSLEYCPQLIKGNFDCENNILQSLAYFPQNVYGKIFLEYNETLLKYKNQSHVEYIREMSDYIFFRQENFSFWYQLHLEDKIKIEHIHLLKNLEIPQIINNNKKIKKV